MNVDRSVHRLPLFLVSLLASVACSEPAPDDVLVPDEGGKVDGNSAIPLGTFRSLPGEGEIGFSALVLRADGTYYEEFCNGFPAEPECVLGHDAGGAEPRGDFGSELSGEVHLTWGTYQRFFSPITGKRFIHLDRFGDASIIDDWTFSYDGSVFRLWREQPELGEPDPDGSRVNRLTRAESICWTARDCEHQGIGDGPFTCTDETVGPGACLINE